MKTTVNLDDDLIRRAKAVAAESGTTLTRLLEDGLRLLLDRRREDVEYRLHWSTIRGRSVPPVDPADRDALLDHLQDRA